MTWIVLIAAVLALVAASLLVAAPRLRTRRLHRRSPERILFPVLGSTVSRSTLDAALRLAQADSATIVPAYIATVPMTLNLEAPIPRECETAMPLLEAIERRAHRLDVPVDSRIERGRTPRHALAQLIEHERFDRIVVPAQTSRSDGFPPDDVAWLLERAPGEVVVLRPDGAAKRRARKEAAIP
jgi:nucleotide-binding universal stress UspA family protein